MEEQFKFRDQRSSFSYFSMRIASNVEWCFINVHSSGYTVLLQWDKRLGKPMIWAGCHYFTLAQARRHWVNEKHHRSRKARAEALMLIGSLVRRAQENGCLRKGYKFNETLPPLAKTRKKVAKRAKTATRRRRR